MDGSVLSVFGSVAARYSIGRNISEIHSTSILTLKLLPFGPSPGPVADTVRPTRTTGVAAYWLLHPYPPMDNVK